MDKSNKKKIIISVTSIIALVIVVASATYAWWVWQSNSANDVTINLTGSSVITFVGGTDISGTLIPVVNKNDSYVSKEFYVNPSSANLSFNLYLKLTSFPSALAHQSFKWELYLQAIPLANGNFASTSQGDVITLGENMDTGSAGTTTNYHLDFWIDGGNFDNPAGMAGQMFYFDLYATGSDSSLVDIDS